MLLIVNDKAAYNELYRRALIERIQSKGIDTLSIGLFDDVRSFFKVLFYCMVKQDILSSNLKANIFVLIFSRGHCSIIINGLGRYRAGYIFRRGFAKLLHLKRNGSKVIFQNYADYRYYRRFSSHVNLHWVPGSGGVARKTGEDNKSFVVVQRDSKIMAVSDSLNEFAQLVEHDEVSLRLIGCTQESSVLKKIVPAYESMGRYSQAEIFIEGKSFIQPEGYGEGVPHTLVDAVCSTMNIYIKKKCFVRYGLNKLGFTFMALEKGWGELAGDETVSSILQLDSVNQTYLGIVLDN